MKFKVQHFIDFATRGDTMQVVNFSVGGMDLMRRCAHLINAYRYFKLGRISIKLVPASTLPVDPTGLSYDDSDLQAVDPRDQLTPGLIRITNGEDIADQGWVSGQEDQIFNSMMLDPRWYKFSLQSGFRRSAKPLFWYVGQLHQDVYPGAIQNVPYVTSGTGGVDNAGSSTIYFDTLTGADGIQSAGVYRRANFSDPHGFFQTGKKGRMGWMRTDALVEYGSTHVDPNNGVFEKAEVTPFPTCRVITMVLPKMHKTNYYYRCYVTEEVYFSGVRTFGPGDPNNVNSGYASGIDNFVELPAVNTAKFPYTYKTGVFPDQTANATVKMNDGNWGQN